jgi:hypothetical protein
VLPFDFDFSDVRGRFTELDLSLLDHEELQKHRVPLHVQVHGRHIGNWNTAVHPTVLPVEVLGHKPNHVFAVSDSCFISKVRRHLELVHANRFALDPCQILKIYEQHSDLTINCFYRKLSLFDQLNSFSFPSF